MKAPALYRPLLRTACGISDTQRLSSGSVHTTATCETALEPCVPRLANVAD